MPVIKVVPPPTEKPHEALKGSPPLSDEEAQAAHETNAQRARQRLFAEPLWRCLIAVRWIAFRDVARIDHNHKGARRYGREKMVETDPEGAFLRALRLGEIHALDDDNRPVPPGRWRRYKQGTPWPDVWLRSRDMTAQWPSHAAGLAKIGKRISSEASAKKFAEKYIAAEEAAGRMPSADGLEIAASNAGIVGGRDLLRKAARSKIGRGRGRPKTRRD